MSGGWHNSKAMTDHSALNSRHIFIMICIKYHPCNKQYTILPIQKHLLFVRIVYCVVKHQSIGIDWIKLDLEKFAEQS